jgi:hypothetical protein
MPSLEPACHYRCLTNEFRKSQHLLPKKLAPVLSFPGHLNRSEQRMMSSEENIIPVLIDSTAWKHPR